MKPSSRRSGDSSSARSGGTIVTWLHMQEKLGTPSALARFSVSAVEGAVVSKPIAKKTTSRSGFSLGDPQRVERRVDHPHVGALGLGVEQRALGARHAHHVAEAGEDHARLVGDRDAVVDAAHRDHADRAARARARARRWPAAGRRRRTCRSSGCARRRPPSPCSGGRARRWRGSRRPARGPSSASRNSSTNLMRPPPLEARERDAGVHEQRVARRDRRRRARSRPSPRAPVVVRAQREAARVVDARRRASPRPRRRR